MKEIKEWKKGGKNERNEGRKEEWKGTIKNKIRKKKIKGWKGERRKIKWKNRCNKK